MQFSAKCTQIHKQHRPHQPMLSCFGQCSLACVRLFSLTRLPFWNLIAFYSPQLSIDQTQASLPHTNWLWAVFSHGTRRDKRAPWTRLKRVQISPFQIAPSTPQPGKGLFFCRQLSLPTATSCGRARFLALIVVAFSQNLERFQQQSARRESVDLPLA